MFCDYCRFYETRYKFPIHKATAMRKRIYREQKTTRYSKNHWGTSTQWTNVRFYCRNPDHVKRNTVVNSCRRDNSRNWQPKRIISKADRNWHFPRIGRSRNKSDKMPNDPNVSQSIWIYLIAYRSILLSTSGIIYIEAYPGIIPTEEFHFEFVLEFFLKRTSGTSVTPCIISHPPQYRARAMPARSVCHSPPTSRCVDEKTKEKEKKRKKEKKKSNLIGRIGDRGAPVVRPSVRSSVRPSCHAHRSQSVTTPGVSDTCCAFVLGTRARARHADDLLGDESSPSVPFRRFLRAEPPLPLDRSTPALSRATTRKRETRSRACAPRDGHGGGRLSKSAQAESVGSTAARSRRAPLRRVALRRVARRATFFQKRAKRQRGHDGSRTGSSPRHENPPRGDNRASRQQTASSARSVVRIVGSAIAIAHNSAREVGIRTWPYAVNDYRNSARADKAS